MLKRLVAAAVLALAACTTYADPTSIRAPQNSAEWEAYRTAAGQLEPVRAKLSASNQDICALPCPLNIKLGVASGIGAFASRSEVWMPIPMAQETRTDDERALVLAHEWAHVIQGDPGGFDEGRELRAECMGAMLAMRAGFDPRRGLDLHRRMARREASDQILLLFVGMVGGGTSLNWAERIATIERAAATDASRAAMARVCGAKI